MEHYSVNVGRSGGSNIPIAPTVEGVTQALARATIQGGDFNTFGVSGLQSEIGWAGQQFVPIDKSQQQRQVNVYRQQQQQQQQHPHQSQSRGGHGVGNFNGATRRYKKQDGRKGKGYRRLWEQVTKVGSGQPLESSNKLSFSEMSVEDLVRVIQSLPPDTSVVLAVSQALCYLDSRALAALLKELAKVGCTNRAIELFDWLRNFEPTDELASLCDVYTYTTMVSLCGQQRQLRRGIQLVAEMRARGIQCNVHTYSALMNVCIKCGELELAIDVYKQMKPEGCQPNVVTFNTLIDVYGKTGQWEEAVKVLTIMKEEGLEPEIRTYNTAIIACNMCGQPEEALKVYDRLIAAGHTPIATTYTALISAYGKCGQLQKALQTFETMVRTGCERNIITYNALLATCERSGEWELALQLFNQMHKEGCHPNTVSFNSLINVCAQSGKWEKAAEVFERMNFQNCKPDSMTYTALLHAFEKGGQWHRAVRIFEQMVQQGCRLDTLVHHTIIDLLWQSGVVWAQGKALQLFNSALRNYHVRLGVLQSTSDDGLEASVPSLSVGVAVLSLLKWLGDTRQSLEQDTSFSLGSQVVIVVGKTKNSNREQTSVEVKESIVKMLNGLKAPVKSTDDTTSGLRCYMEASDFAEWLCTEETKEALRKYVEDGLHVEMSREILAEDLETERRCREAFMAVRHFENLCKLNYELMGREYLDQRRDLVSLAWGIWREYNLKHETIHDAILLMDRIMSTGVRIEEGAWQAFVGALVFISACQSELPSQTQAMENMDSYLILPLGSVAKMAEQIRAILCNDTSAISAVRVLKLFYERLGHKVPELGDGASVFNRIHDFSFVPELVNIRPSVIAAALLYQDRESKGKVKSWPSSLMHLTQIHVDDREFQAALTIFNSLDNNNPFLTPTTVLIPGEV
eukprot:g4378.t1